MVGYVAHLSLWRETNLIESARKVIISTDQNNKLVAQPTEIDVYLLVGFLPIMTIFDDQIPES